MHCQRARRGSFAAISVRAVAVQTAIRDTCAMALFSEPFETFTFSPVGVSVCRLGPYGTAAKKLKSLELKP